MRFAALTFPLGIFLPAFFSQLPPPWLLGVALMIAIILIWRRPGSVAGLFLVGMVWGCGWGYWQLSHQLAIEDDKFDTLVTGTIVSLPKKDERKVSFRLRVEDVAGDQKQLRTLQLSWYNPSENLESGQRWQFRVRLRAPRGFANPGAFDYRGWLFAEGVSATGYARGEARRQLEEAPCYSLHRLRQRIFDQIEFRTRQPASGYLAALVLGESALISHDRLQRLVSTGTIHLMVVSGLHVGMMTTLGYLFGLFLGRLIAAAGFGLPAPITAAIFAMAVAFLYCALTGFGLPAVRALVMTSAVVGAVSCRRIIRPSTAFVYALCGVALIDPLAVTRMGFWLSFSAVAGLLFYFSPRASCGKLKGLVLAQLVVFVALLPGLIFFQGQVSLLMMPTNLIVIPWISLAVVPLALAGTALLPLPILSDTLWQIVAWQLVHFDSLLARVESGSSFLGPIALKLQTGNLGLLLVTIIVALGLLAPVGLRVRTPAILLVLSLPFYRPQFTDELLLTVLDVGQGTAVVVQVEDKTLVYDAGPAYSAAFDAGSAIVAPYLKSRGVWTVNALVVSHDDTDHSGGTRGLLAQLPAERILAGQPDKLGLASVERCVAGQHWQWQDVSFEVLSPGEPFTADNNNSCVLLVTSPHVRVLLAGDIETAIESTLVANYDLSDLDVLLVPHHGSKTSSSPAFVAETQPQHAVFSAGFNHHFGHPHKDVVARYRQVSTLWNTAESGALEFRWTGEGKLSIFPYRSASPRYWERG